LSVANAGTPISEAAMKNLFKPFHRGVNEMKGLGLGLYIALEIARAHGGTLDATSTPDQTRFTFKMPIA
jgi:sigma-B regulation protein RsbU (phosphoserine phosphatase)